MNLEAFLYKFESCCYFCDLGEYFIFGDKMPAQFQRALTDVRIRDRNGQTFGIEFGS